jgi:excinuclease ABC subunit B
MKRRSNRFQIRAGFEPRGDQPQAIAQLVEGLKAGARAQVLLGITGSGKTFSMAHVIEKVQRPTLIIAHNKTLAGQLYQEFKAFFPENAVEYFVSYYDYYQPEAYIARTDTYIEKELAINDQIDRMRLSATRSLIEREDVIIIASVSCLYGLGMPEYYMKLNLHLEVGQEVDREALQLRLVDMQYHRGLILNRGGFRIQGDQLELVPAYEEDQALRISFWGNTIEEIWTIDPVSGHARTKLDRVTVYPGSHHVMPEEVRKHAMGTIREELKERILHFEGQGRTIERNRIEERTLQDLEMMREMGFCKGIENYSRHFTGRQPGQAPPCLLDYFPADFLLFVDESHQTLPQIRAMSHGDRSRKESLIEYGFRLPSAFDNRPLTFDEFYLRINQAIYVSATPAPFEIREAQGRVVEQIIRPTGLLDPKIEVRPARSQVDDSLHEIALEVGKGRRVLVTTLTKKLAEELTKYLNEVGVKAKYLHSDIDTLERAQILADLRRGVFDVLVGINLLREGLDLPEVSLVMVLDADKEGFLRSETALIQTCGRAARHVEGRVILYADKMTEAIRYTVGVTERRRKHQEEYNRQHGITPQSVRREISDLGVASVEEAEEEPLEVDQIAMRIAQLRREMEAAASNYEFEEAARLRDQMRRYETMAVLTPGEDHEFGN